MRRSNLLIS